MKKQWTDKEIAYFKKRIRPEEKPGWFDNVFWYIVMATCLGATIWICIKLYGLYKIHMWLQSL